MVVFTFMNRACEIVVRRVLLANVIVLIAVSAGSAQQANAPRCRAAFLARGLTAADTSAANSCFDLAAAIHADLSAKAWLEPRDVQPSGAGTAAPAGSPAQTSAVPSIQPTSFASAILAATVQDSGSTTITAVSVNPAMLFSSTADPVEIARLSRMLDLTVFLPIDNLDADEDGRIDYGGVRGRINFSASAQASELERAVREQLTAIVRNELGMVNQIEAILSGAPDPGECAKLLTDANADADAVIAKCGGALTTRIDEAPYAALREAAGRAREDADAKYLGLDLRFDTGDPSLGKIRNAAGNALLVAMGFGRRFNPTGKGATAGMRGRLGVRYVNLRDTTAVDWQLDGGVAFESSRVVQSQRLELSGGVEFRLSGNRDAAEALQTRFAEFRAGLNVPIAGGTSIAISGAVPLMGDRSPTMAVSGNWQQLLEAVIR